MALLTAASAAAAPLPAVEAPPPVVLKERPVRLPPLFWFERDPETRSHLLMAAMLYWDIRDGDTAHRLLFPIFYRWREGDRSFFMSLPLVLSYQRPGDRWRVIGPFYRKADEEKTQTLFFPLYWQRVRREGGRVTAALPFLFYDYRSHDGRTRDSVFLGGFLRRRGDMNLGLIVPYFWETDPDSRFRVLFPVYWHGRSPQARFDVLVPFYHVWTADNVWVSTASAPAGRDRMGLFPLVGAGWGAGYRSHYLFPLYYFSADEDRRDFLTIPYSSFRKGDGRMGHVGLYFYNHDPDLRVDGIFPLWFHRASTDGFEDKTQFLNFYDSQENGERFQTLFPLYGYWSDPDGSRLLSWGVWRRRDIDGTAGWAFLYLWKDTEGGDRNRIFLPLYWSFKRAPDWQVDVFFPFYTHYQDGDTSVTAVFPFLIRRSPGKSSLSLFLLYWQDRDQQGGVTTLAPFFFSQYDAHRRMFFSPLLWTRRSRSSSEGIFPPVYWYRSAEARRTFVVPLYWRVKTASRDLRILAPFYRWREKDVTEVGVFPLWGRRTAQVEKGGVVHREPRGGYLFPFYWYDTDGKGNSLWIIPPILGFVTKDGAGTENETFNMQYLVLGNVRKRRDSLEHGFFPLYQYVRKKDYVNWWAPRIVALAAYERKGTDIHGVAVPCFWWRSAAADRNLFLPFYYSSRRYEVSGSTATGFQRGELTGRDTIFFPLYWSGQEGDHSYRYVLPFYAHNQEGPSRWTVVAPLWVSYNGTEGRRLRVFFPLYWRYRSGTEQIPAPAVPAAGGPVLESREVTVWGPVYRVDVRKGDQLTRTVGFAPLFSRTYTDPQDKYFEVLGGLFGRDVQGGRRRFRILYFFYTPARPV